MHAELARLAPRTPRLREKVKVPELTINSINEEHLWFEYCFKLKAAAKRLGIGLTDDDTNTKGNEHLYYLLFRNYPFLPACCSRPLIPTWDNLYRYWCNRDLWKRCGRSAQRSIRRRAT